MKYMVLICGDESAEAAIGPEEERSIVAEYQALADELSQKGKLLGGDRLRPSTTATTVRTKGDEVLTTDGPYAETKEQLGGYFILQADDLDEAIQIAARIPAARHGSVELRPIWEM